MKTKTIQDQRPQPKLEPKDQHAVTKRYRPELVLLDNAEFCKLFRISERTAYQWRNDGFVPFLVVNRRIRYRFSDVLQCMKKLTTRKSAKR